MNAVPSKTVANVPGVPDTPLVAAALAHARAHATPAVFNHVQRSWLFGLLIARKAPNLAGLDTEAHAVAVLLHDLGWNVRISRAAPDRCFEVASADAARAFLAREAPDWDAARVQLVWDAIALHTAPRIATHKGPEVAACALGALADFLGWRLPGGLLTEREYTDVVREFPRAGFFDNVKEVCCMLCKEKPETTYDYFIGEVGELYLEGYSREGKRGVDIVLAARALDDRDP